MTGWIGLGQRTQSLSLDFPRSTLTPSFSYNNHAKITVEILNIKFHPAWISNYTTTLMEPSERLSPDIKRSVLSLWVSWGCRWWRSPNSSFSITPTTSRDEQLFRPPIRERYMAANAHEHGRKWTSFVSVLGLSVPRKAAILKAAAAHLYQALNGRQRILNTNPRWTRPKVKPRGLPGMRGDFCSKMLPAAPFKNEAPGRPRGFRMHCCHYKEW